MAGGSRNYDEMYSKYKQGVVANTDFEKYVDSKGDLKNAWTLIDAYNKGEDVDKKFAGKYPHPAGLSPSQQAEYWQKRGATSKAAFGRSHAAEDAALYSGTYQGGTDVRKGTDAYKDYFDDKGTRFDKYLEDPNRNKPTVPTTTTTTTPEINYPWDDPTQKTNVYHPMLVPDYEAPEAHSMFGAEYQPWSQASVDDGYVPENVWNYAPPQMTVGRPQWGANPMGPLSEQPWIDIENAKKAAAASDEEFREGPEGNQDATRNADGSFVDKWGNTVQVGYSSFANMLKGISIADETAAARWAASGSQGVIDSTGAATPASSGQGVTFDPSGNPYAL